MFNRSKLIKENIKEVSFDTNSYENIDAISKSLIDEGIVGKPSN